MATYGRKTERQGVYLEAGGNGTWLSADEVRRFDDTVEDVAPISGLPIAIRGVTWRDGEVYPVVALAPDAHRAVIADDGEARAVLMVDRARVGVLPDDADFTTLRQVLEGHRV